MFVAFAAQPGQPAYDGAAAQGPFASALLAELARPPQPIEALMRGLRLRVIRLTAGQQVPWSQSSLLRPASLSLAAPPPGAPAE
ncbi:caspase family protein [Shimia sp.]|uniref:caspase family protein n=1 Tax=Shimia sp. TaxID=1954381 RepID=UPI003567A757